MDLKACVAFLLIKDGRLLLEKRKHSKAVDPGMVAIPGGHCEGAESIEETLFRESYEELEITPTQYAYLCTLIHKSQEMEKINYFVVNAWEGDIKSNEAECVFWVGFDEVHKIDIAADRVAVSEYVRVFGEAL